MNVSTRHEKIYGFLILIRCVILVFVVGIFAIMTNDFVVVMPKTRIYIYEHNAIGGFFKAELTPFFFQKHITVSFVNFNKSHQDKQNNVRHIGKPEFITYS